MPYHEPEFRNCGICGEPIAQDQHGWFLEEVGEFWDESRGEGNESVVAHAYCGIDLELPIA